MKSKIYNFINYSIEISVILGKSCIWFLFLFSILLIFSYMSGYFKYIEAVKTDNRVIGVVTEVTGHIDYNMLYSRLYKASDFYNKKEIPEFKHTIKIFVTYNYKNKIYKNILFEKFTFKPKEYRYIGDMVNIYINPSNPTEIYSLTENYKYAKYINPFLVLNFFISGILLLLFYNEKNWLNFINKKV